MENHPAFFKFFIPDFSANELKIPPSFVRSIKGYLPETVGLRDRYNNIWQVKVEKAGDNWYFKDGWIEFVKDNLLHGGEMIVFEYFSKGLFDFKILGSSACETNGVGGPKNTNDKKIEDDDENDGGEDDEDEDGDENEDGEETEDDDEDGEETEDDDYVPMTREKNIKQRDDNGQGMKMTDGEAATQGKRFDWFGTEIFKSGLAPKPSNPYFVTKTRSRISDLYIPVDVVKNYNLQLPQVIMLVDPKGREFRAKLKMWRDKRIFYSGGWKCLCRMNLVEKEDTCICEFMQRGGHGELYLSVSFVRANSTN